MTLSAQSFLPMLYENMVQATLPITTTTFTGAETSILVGGVTYPLKRYTYRSLQDDWNDLTNPPVDYMGVPLGASDSRVNYADSLLRLDNQVEGLHDWKCCHGHARYDVTYGPLLMMLRAKGMDYIASPVVPPIGASNGSFNWYVNHPFANLSKFAFLDFNWVEHLEVESGNIQPASVSIGAPTADPGAGLHIKLMLVQHNPEIINNAPLYSTLRFIKITAGVAAAGTYTWPLTITNTDGATVSATVDLIVA